MHSPDFNLVAWFVTRAAAAYQSEANIRELFPNTQKVTTTSRGVQYFFELDHHNRRTIVVVRGTDNFANSLEDANFHFSKNRQLGIWVHRGFDEDAAQIYDQIIDLLPPHYPVLLTGHSLGAAVSALLMIYLQAAGFQIGHSYNFGQPKFTNKEGVQKYRSLPLTRVVDENDLVPLVPPIDLIDELHGGYEHMSPEIILLRENFYAYLEEHDAERKSVGSFWRNLPSESVSAHFVKNYIFNIKNKLGTALQVPFDQCRQFYN
ncbi:lipase family protein [Halioxenophilus sp. WMMB6]|uniref:lipase family protein n=1 Tax=Halioxenophilus sp. WMMB6 TaxID=3073815 RepID=UPI00295F29FF|nr:lipase family protein [Halioxenophilus sp. WMMB6]